MASILKGRLLGEDGCERMDWRGQLIDGGLGKTASKASVHFKKLISEILRIFCS